MIKITIEESGKLTTHTSDSAIRSIELWDGTAWTFGTVSRFSDLASEAGHIVTNVLPTGDMVEHAIATDGAPIDPATMADYLTSEANRARVGIGLSDEEVESVVRGSFDRIAMRSFRG